MEIHSYDNTRRFECTHYCDYPNHSHYFNPHLTPIVSLFQYPATGWAPKSKSEIKAAIAECLKLSPTDCSEGSHGPIGSWDLSAVKSMSRWFHSASSFNGDISEWDVSKVTTMRGMFASASSFNGDISKWDVSKVTNTFGMFYSASSFNGDISKWDVSKVTDMKDMFAHASSFNGDIATWDVSRVTNMEHMFLYAASFAQTLCGKWYTSAANKDGMFDESSGRMCETTTTNSKKTTSMKTPTLTLTRTYPTVFCPNPYTNSRTK